jgi:hypothetical protein
MIKIKTMKQLAKTISVSSLFKNVGTFTESEALKILRDNKFKWCKKVYQKEAVSDEYITTISKDHVFWYENRSGGVIFYTLHPSCEYYQKFTELNKQGGRY